MTQIFHKMKYDKKSSLKVTKGHLKISKSSFSAIYFVQRLIFLKLFKNINIMKTQRHIYDDHFTKIILAHSFMDRFWWKFLWMLNKDIISLNHIWPKVHFYVMKKFCYFFTLRPSDLNTTWTFALMDNFFPCLYHAHHKTPWSITNLKN